MNSNTDPIDDGTVDIFEGQRPMSIEEGGTEKLPGVKHVERTLKTDLHDLFEATFDNEFKGIALRIRERCAAAPDVPEHGTILKILDGLITYRKAMVSSDIVKAEEIINTLIARVGFEKLDALNKILPVSIMRIQAQLQSRFGRRLRQTLDNEL